MHLLTARKVTNSVYADATDVLKTNFKLTFPKVYGVKH